MPFDDQTPPPPLPDDADIIGDLRTDHAGEAGAVYIYKGILTIARDAEVRAFAREHLATETAHLEKISAVLPAAHRSRLTPLWRVAGFFTGFLPALFGPRAIYATIEAVETFVDRHYQEQIDRLDGTRGYPALRALLVACQADERHHRDDASARAGDAKPGPLLRAWTSLVASGSEAAVSAARRI